MELFSSNEKCEYDFKEFKQEFNLAFEGSKVHKKDLLNDMSKVLGIVNSTMDKVEEQVIKKGTSSSNVMIGKDGSSNPSRKKKSDKSNDSEYWN